MPLSPQNTNTTEMFSTIAERYDFLNDVLSIGIHRLWRRRMLNKMPKQTDGIILDICTGSGVMLPALQQRANAVIGVDASRGMLKQAVSRGMLRDPEKCFLVESDAHKLPLRSESIDIATVAFGVRNFRNFDVALGEVHRVLKKGGTFYVLELGQPRNKLVSIIYSWYSQLIIPFAGLLLAADARAYRYLSDTSSNFPSGNAFAEILERCSFEVQRTEALSFGIAYLYLARKGV